MVISCGKTCACTLVLVLVVTRGGSACAADDYLYRLFDGESLAGWTVENGCGVRGEDAAILLESGNGWLRSDQTYTDFKLHIEWKALKSENYDAGIYLRADATGTPFPRRGYQVNLLQGHEGNIKALPGAASSGLVKPAGQWNTFDITVLGETVAMVINGKPAYKVGGLTIPRGSIGIQVEVPKGGQFLLRNLSVIEAGYRSLFNGKDFSGWEGAGEPAEVCWQVQEGAFVGLKQKGPWLRTKEEFSDFNLRLQYRVDSGANSGIYVRVPPSGKHHRNSESESPAGFEIQLLDDSADKYRNLKDYQYSGSLYDIAGATRHVSKPPDEWNTLELNCNGSRITSIHNGVVIVDAGVEAYPLLKLRKLKGFLGLQNHGGGVSFRNIRIGPALSLPTN